MSKYKLIATDFDDTLLKDDKTISNYTKDTLLELKEKGYYIVGATSRNLLASKSFFDINMFNYLILNNGSNIYDVKKSKCIYSNLFDKNIIIELYNSYKNICKNMIFSSLNHYYVLKNIEDKIYNKKITNETLTKDFVKLNIFFDSNYDLESELLKIKNKYKMLNSFIMKSNSNGNWITIIPNSINKLTSIKWLINDLNINTNEVIYFGDSTNDIQAIKELGLGVAMKNAQKEIKDIANEITLYDNNNDGLARFLNEKLGNK